MNVRVGLTSDLETCRMLCRKVFAGEQNVPEEAQQDGRNDEAHRILALVNERFVGCARILIYGEIGKIGRVCVLSGHCGTRLGKRLFQVSLDCLRALLNVRKAELGAQVTTFCFFKCFGFKAYGAKFEDAGLPHRMMVHSP